MSQYQIANSDGVIRNSDGAYIPNDINNIDWQAYQQWRTAGNIPDAALVVNLLPTQALNALAESDKTILRCTENSIAVPAAWTTYRKALRAIINGTDTTSTTLPTVPTYPAGT